MISGDLIDCSKADLNSLTEFKQLNCPIYFVTGNHEYYIKNSNDFIKNLNQYNIQHISNNSKFAVIVLFESTVIVIDWSDEVKSPVQPVNL